MNNKEWIDQKQKIRKTQLALRKDFPTQQLMACSQQINEKLIHLFQHKKPNVVHAYWPMRDEIDIRPVLEWLITNGVLVVLPKVINKKLMVPVVYETSTSLVAGVFGTLHPGSDKQYDGPIDTFIIPGLAFDIQKNRLGYGAGYFDRFLKNYSTAQKIAVALPFQIMKQLPAESHDVPMDLIIVPEKN